MPPLLHLCAPPTSITVADGKCATSAAEPSSASVARNRAYTLKPSARRHALCFSISSPHASSPLLTIQSSRTLRVSGHAQQILHVGFFSPAASACTGAATLLGVESIPDDRKATRVQTTRRSLSPKCTGRNLHGTSRNYGSCLLQYDRFYLRTYGTPPPNFVCAVCRQSNPGHLLVRARHRER